MPRFKIPVDIERHLLPSAETLLDEVLVSTSPPVNDLIPPALECFSNTASIINIQHVTLLKKQPLPSRDSVKAWRTLASSNEEFQSFKYPFTQSGVAALVPIRLPVWIIEFWRQMHEMVDTCDRWSNGILWLQRFIDEGSGPVFQTAIGIVKALQWSTAAQAGAHSDDALPAYLGPHWLSDTHITQLNDTLISQLASTDVHIISPVWFLKLVSIYRHGRDHYLTAKDTNHIRSVGEQLKASATARFAGIINIQLGEGGVTLPGPYESGNHWVVFAFNRLDGMVAFGDSYHHLWPTELHDILQWWLGQHLDDAEIRMERMESTEQHDQYSCGILAFNALCHQLLPETYPLLDATSVDEARVDLFIKVIRNISGCASTSSEESPKLKEARVVLKPKKQPRQVGTNQKRSYTVANPEPEEESKTSKLQKIARQTYHIANLNTPSIFATNAQDDNEDPEADIKAEADVDLTLYCDKPIGKTDPKLGGRPRNPLLEKLVVRCYKKTEPRKYVWRCAGSCGFVLSRRSVERVIRHCKDCYELKPTLRKLAATEAIKGSSSKQLEAMDLQESSISQAPTIATPTTALATPQRSPPGIVQTLALGAGRKRRQAELDHALVVLFCVSGLPAYLICRPEFVDIFRIADPYYRVPSRDALEGKLIPNEQEYVKSEQLLRLKQEDNLTISFDGGTSRGKEAFWNVHVSTKADEVFLVEGREATRESHTAEWISKLAIETIKEIGPSRFSGVVSDSTGNTRAARKIITTEYPTIIKLADCCHHLNLLAKDLAKISFFQETITVVRTTITFFNHSHGAIAELRNARKHLKIGRGLETIGKTRFGTLFLSAISVQRTSPAITQVRLKMGKEFEKLREYYQPLDSPSMDTNMYRFKLAAFIMLGLPTTKAIACLEGEGVTASDVFLFLHAVVLETSIGMQKAKIPMDVQEEVIGILNTRFRQLLEPSPNHPNYSGIYLAATFLNPNLLKSDLFKARSDHKASARKTPLTGIRNPQVFEDVANYLLALGGQEILHGHKIAFTKWKGKAKQFKEKLRCEFMAYARGQYPYNTPFKEDEPRACPKWWEQLIGNTEAEILPHLSSKIYSVRVNSMAEERTVSKMTWITPPLRSRLSVSSMVVMTQVGQYYRATKPKALRLSSNRFPVHQAQFCAVRSELFPSEDVDITPSSLQDLDTDDTWLDEPVDKTPAEFSLITDNGEINMSSSILSRILADEPPQTKEATCSGDFEEMGSTGEDSDDNDFASSGWI